MEDQTISGNNNIQNIQRLQMASAFSIFHYHHRPLQKPFHYMPIKISKPNLVFSSPYTIKLRGLECCYWQKQRAFMADQSNKKVVEVYETEEDVAVSLAKYVADLSAKFAKERGSFNVVLSGGYLIHNIRKLTESPYIDSIEWPKWHVFWVDDRVVPKTQSDSDYKLAFDGFLSKVPIPPGNVHAINDALAAEVVAEDYQNRLRHLVDIGILPKSSISGFPKFDLMLLGMGPDGHIASLFPGHPLLKENEKWVAHIMDSPKPPPQRITLTFPVINSSAYIAMVVCGPGEVDAVHKALGETENPDLLPVQMVTPETELKWFLEKVAASKLQE